MTTAATQDRASSTSLMSKGTKRSACHFRLWHIASFRGAAEFGRNRGIADIDQAAPTKLNL
jgi:hypothetical protein